MQGKGENENEDLFDCAQLTYKPNPEVIREMNKNNDNSIFCYYS